MIVSRLRDGFRVFVCNEKQAFLDVENRATIRRGISGLTGAFHLGDEIVLHGFLRDFYKKRPHDRCFGPIQQFVQRTHLVIIDCFPDVDAMCEPAQDRKIFGWWLEV